MKVGRNDPCPCGSGKKYKKCCMNKSNPTPANRAEEKSPIEQTSILKSQLEQLSTKRILENIQAAGLDISEHRFINEIQSVPSALKLYQLWEERLQLGRGQLPPAFYFSILILAKRLVPDQILLEDLRDLMQDGYNCIEPYPNENGLFIWWKLWKDVQVWLKSQKITSVDQLDQAVKQLLPKSISNWALDFDAALEEAGKVNKQFISMRYVFTDDFLNCFPHSTEDLKEQITIAREEAANY